MKMEYSRPTSMTTQPHVSRILCWLCNCSCQTVIRIRLAGVQGLVMAQGICRFFDVKAVVRLSESKAYQLWSFTSAIQIESPILSVFGIWFCSLPFAAETESHSSSSTKSCSLENPSSVAFDGCSV